MICSIVISGLGLVGGKFHLILEQLLWLAYQRLQAYEGKLTLECSKKAGILADLVKESSGALPSYIKRSLESNQNFLSKNLLALLPRGCITQLIVALRSLSRLGEISKFSSLQTKLFAATWICSSREMSAETVRIPASPLARKNGSSTRKSNARQPSL